MSSTQGSASATSFVYYRKSEDGQLIGDPARYHEYNLFKKKFFEMVRRGDAMPKAFKAYNEALREAAYRRKAGGGELNAVDIADTGRLMQNFTVKYAQAPYIGLELMPMVPSPQEGSTYIEYVRGPEFQASRQRGGRGTRTSTNEVDGYNFLRQTYMTEALDDKGIVGRDAVISDDTPINAMFNLRETVDAKIALAREFTIRDILTDANNYATSNKKTLTAGLRWDDAGGDPVNDILTALQSIWMGQGSSRLVAWTSLEVWNVIRQSDKFLKLLSANNEGILSAEQFTNILGLDGLLVSEARENTANIAKTPVFSRLWGNFFGICRVSTTPQLKNASFGFTFRWTPKAIGPEGIETHLWFDPEEGAFGSFGYKVAMKEIQKVVAADTGYLFTTPIN
jgi:hypothetical protein